MIDVSFLIFYSLFSLTLHYWNMKFTTTVIIVIFQPYILLFFSFLIHLFIYLYRYRINTPGVIERVKNLFRGYNKLILGFNTFLPEGEGDLLILRLILLFVFTMFSIVLYCFALYFVVLWCSILQCVVLYLLVYCLLQLE